MSAFGQSVENSVAHDWQVHLHRFVREQVRREREWLETRLRELKPGETWCHHEAVVDSEGVWQVSGHVLGPGQGCAVHGASVQYGPAPGPWPPTECDPSDEMRRKAMQACTNCHKPNRVLLGDTGVWACTKCDAAGWILHNRMGGK